MSVAALYTRAKVTDDPHGGSVIATSATARPGRPVPTGRTVGQATDRAGATWAARPSIDGSTKEVWMVLAHGAAAGETADNVELAAARLARFAIGTERAAVPQAVIEKARVCLADYLACALEAAHLTWGRQAIAYGSIGPKGPCGVIGTELALGAGEAAFVNGALGHGLVREDMHVASCTHLGVVVWPALLALGELDAVPGDDLLACAAIGYEVGARVGRALFDTDLQARIRPTGTVGAIGAAAACARLLGLTQDQTIAAIGLAANMASGVNEWPWAGGHEMVFHAATAARSAVTATLLAREGVFASPSAIDGRAGLFAAYDRRDRAARIVPLGDGRWEIMSVYFKPAPACNYVQTPVQAALSVVRQGATANNVERIDVASFSAAIGYPGCDQPGPFPGVFEAKMSIQYAVAAVLARGEIGEANYRRLDDPETLRLARLVSLSVDPEFEAAYPLRQGAGVAVTLRDGSVLSERLDDVRSYDAGEVRSRFADVARAEIGADAARTLLAAVDGLDRSGNAAAIMAATRRKFDVRRAA
jgi:2-methylcitrate dehydratase PrpD